MANEDETFRALIKWDFARLDAAYNASWGLPTDATLTEYERYLDILLEQAHWTRAEWYAANNEFLRRNGFDKD